MTRKFDKPPVVEVVCEFRFASSEPWDLTIPGLLFERVRAEFPTIEQAAVIQVALDPAGNRAVPHAQPSVRFISGDRGEIIQVAANLLAVHRVGSYRSWNDLKTRILSSLDTYCEVAKYESLNRIGLRYLNRIEFPTGIVELSEYFRIIPRVPEPVPQELEAFLAQIQVAYASPGAKLRIAFGTAASDAPETRAFVLDLESFTPDDGAPGVESVASWLEAAHARIEDAFEASFTEKTFRDVFAEVGA